MNVDLQQRGVEFSQLFRDHSNLRPALLEKMPPMQVVRVSQENGEGGPDADNDNSDNLLENGETGDGDVLSGGISVVPPIDNSNALLDLLGGSDSQIETLSTTKSMSNNVASKAPPSNNQDLLDLLGDLGMTTTSVPAPTVPSSINTSVSTFGIGLDNNNGDSIISAMSINQVPFDGSSPASMNIMGSAGLISSYDMLGDTFSQKQQTSWPKLTALDKNGILVQLTTQRGAGCLQVIMIATNNSLNTLEQFLFQVCC